MATGMSTTTMLSGRRIHLLAAVFSGGLLVVLWYHLPFNASPEHGPEWRKQVPETIARNWFSYGQCNMTMSISDKEKAEILNCTKGFKTFRDNNRLVNRPEMERVRVDSHSYLTSESQVLEVGGYTGVDAAKLIQKYNPYYMAMEPIPRYQKILEERYKNNPKFQLLRFGLGKENKTLTLNIDSDATSLFRAKKKSSQTSTETAHIREITQFFRELGVERKPIDLITINCEGCEYELLELLISTGVVKYLKNIQFQFHLDLPGITSQECRYCQIMTLLRRSHKPSFQYSYTWQSWQRLVR